MARFNPKMEVNITQYRIVFFPIACLSVCGDVVKLSVLGFTVYQRAGDLSEILGFQWRKYD